MLAISDIRERLSDRNLSEVARRIGMPYETLYFFVTGRTDNPLYETVRKISEYLEEEK
mgnify:CR=1 FL=1